MADNPADPTRMDIAFGLLKLRCDTAIDNHGRIIMVDCVYEKGEQSQSDRDDVLFRATLAVLKMRQTA